MTNIPEEKGPTEGELGGDYARDQHREGFGDDYARDGGFSGGGGHEDFTREPERVDENK